MLLTKTNTFIIGPVATLLGFIMNAIFIFLSSVFHVENIGLCIILFTIIIYGIMTPLTYKQQKFSKLSARMNPELQKIQKKYIEGVEKSCFEAEAGEEVFVAVDAP